MLDVLKQFKDFDCLLKHKDVKSALSRVKTPECQKVIQKTGCLLEHNKLYLANIPKLCPVTKWESGYYPRAIVDREPSGHPVRVLFMLTVHGRALRQVKRLLKSIYHKNHYYYFHVDQVSRHFFYCLN